MRPDVAKVNLDGQIHSHLSEGPIYSKDDCRTLEPCEVMFIHRENLIERCSVDEESGTLIVAADYLLQAIGSKAPALKRMTAEQKNAQPGNSIITFK